MPIEKIIEIYNEHHDQHIDVDAFRYIDYDKRSKEITDIHIGVKDSCFFNLDVLIDDNFDSLLKSKAGKLYYVPDKEEMNRHAS